MINANQNKPKQYISPFADIPKKYAPFQALKKKLPQYSDAWLRRCVTRGRGKGKGPEFIRYVAKYVAEEIKKEMDELTTTSVYNQ